jgi:hypothetical protein
MFASITCFGVDTRTLRVHVPAFADSYLPGVTVSLKAAQSTYKGHGADCLQRTLVPRSRFRQQLMPGVRPSEGYDVSLKTIAVHRVRGRRYIDSRGERGAARPPVPRSPTLAFCTSDRP